MFNRLFASRVLVSLFALVLAIPAHAQKKVRSESSDRLPEVIVKFREEVASSRSISTVLAHLNSRAGKQLVTDVRPFLSDRHLATLRLSDLSRVAETVDTLATEPSVEYAEPNYRVHIYDDGLPNDPDLGKTWGIQNTGQADDSGQVGTAGSDVHVVPLWQEGFKGDRKILVAVIDTGIDWDHPDLKDNLYTNPGEAGALASDGIDNDHNGFIDDVHGFNFITHTGNSRDDHNHGSHCAGTIGAVGNNGLGVVGVNWNVSLMPVKFLDQNGSGSLDNAVEAINYARIMKANVMSNSWGGGGFSQTMMDAIKAARDAGILFVAAAGNDSNNNDATPSYPASYQVDNIVSVAATDNRDKIASFSNFGQSTVHVAAPGVKVYSTTKGGTYSVFSGTSMATPHASGIAALLMAANPAWTFAEIKDRMIKTSDPVQGLKRKVVAKGRLNAYNAYHGVVPPSQDPDESLWQNQAQVLESKHPYDNDSDLKVTVTHPGAKYLRLHFEKVEAESGYDHVYVEDPSGNAIEDMTGNYANYTTEYVKGDTAVIHLKTDHTVNAYGYKLDAVQFIP